MADQLHPKVRFGYINVLEDEALKVSFREYAVPWTFAIFGGRAYKYPSLERPDELIEYLTDLEGWKGMKVQFDLPQSPATKLDIIVFDIGKEVRRTVKPILRAYMEWFHEMRTGSKRDFESSTKVGFSALAVVVFVAIYLVYSLCRLCRGGKKKSEEKKE